MSRANTLSVLARFRELGAGEGFWKDLSCQKTCVGAGGEHERALDDVYGTGVAVRSCCKKRSEKKLCKSR